MSSFNPNSGLNGWLSVFEELITKMSGNAEFSQSGATSNTTPVASKESCDVWIKIEKFESDDELTSKLEPVLELEVRVEESSPASSSNPEPSNQVVQIDIKPDIKHLKEDSESEGSIAPDVDTVFEPEVKIEVKSNKDNITDDENVTNVEKERQSNLTSQTCDQCGQTFGRQSAYTLHLKSHESQSVTEFQCDRCQRSFPSSANLLRHQRFCTGPVSLTCPVCNQTFRSKTFLKSHMTVHSTEKPYECDLCGKTFKHQCAAARHRRFHTETPDKRFPCSVCDKSFSVIHALERHMRTHTQERPFSCAVCLRAFSHKHNMHKHMRRHDKLVQLNCQICHKEFKLESHLKYHMRVHYTNKKPYNCGLCHKTYSNVQNITTHYKKKHPDHEYIAPMTDAEFANKAWELHKNKNMSDKEHSTYILPEFVQPHTNNDSKEEEILENPLPEPELVILENNCIKLEFKDELVD